MGKSSCHEWKKMYTCKAIRSFFATVNVKLAKHIFSIYIKRQQDKQEDEQDDWPSASEKHFH